ncbi:MAG: DMT family transporter [Chloroflexi bacterium]|nr:DMT family transporter [Chloroflexota bacterium]
MIGELAAFGTAICWAFSSIFFTVAGQQVGSMIVNRMRLLFAVLLLLPAHYLVLGTWFPTGAGLDRWLWLGASGLVGLVLGDACLLQAYLYIGTRLSMLIMAVVPVISTVLAWLFLGENLSLYKVLGICIAVAGISVVVLERNAGAEAPLDRRSFVLGILCALGGALGQALGLILAKRGLVNGFPALSGVMMRMLVAMLSFWLLTLLMGQARPTLARTFHSPRALRSVAAGSFIGPFLGVWLSLIAVQASLVGVASTLMALTPILLLPVAHWAFQEKVSLRAVSGTFVSMAGIALIFMLP